MVCHPAILPFLCKEACYSDTVFSNGVKLTESGDLKFNFIKIA